MNPFRPAAASGATASNSTASLTGGAVLNCMDAQARRIADSLKASLPQGAKVLLIDEGFLGLEPLADSCIVSRLEPTWPSGPCDEPHQLSQWNRLRKSGLDIVVITRTSLGCLEYLKALSREITKAATAIQLGESCIVLDLRPHPRGARELELVSQLEAASRRIAGLESELARQRSSASQQAPDTARSESPGNSIALAKPALEVQPGKSTEDDVSHAAWLAEALELIDAMLPAKAILLVAGRGAESLVAQSPRTAWPFPRLATGDFGGNPVDDHHAIEHLADLQSSGATHLFLPDWMSWWLDHYEGFAERLSRHTTLLKQVPAGSIHELTPAGQPSSRTRNRVPSDSTRPLVMTLLVRDEADIIRSHIEYHLAMGVDLILAMDNGSRDGTTTILREFEARGCLVLTLEDSPDYLQDAWVTDLARRAFREYDAGWVINADADEFYVARDGSLKDALDRAADDVQAVSVRRNDMIPMAEPVTGDPVLDMVVHKRESQEWEMGHTIRDKLVHRGAGGVEIGRGCHHVALGGHPLQPTATPWIETLHFPIRSLHQFESKVRHVGGGRIRNGLSESRYNRWHIALDNGTLGTVFKRYAYTRAQLDAGLRSGTLIENRRIADFRRSLLTP